MSAPLKLYNSLFVLQKCDTVFQRLINRSVESRNGKLDLIVDDDELVDNSTLMILQLSIFLDEYEKHFPNVELAFKTRVITFKKIIRPIVDLIKQWKDIRTFRNLFIAHNFRDLNGKFYIPDLNAYNVPKSALDFQLASDYMKYIAILMLAEFENEIVDMLGYFSQFIPPKKYFHDIINTNQSLDEMYSEVNSLCKQFSKNYRLPPIMKYLPPT